MGIQAWSAAYRLIVLVLGLVLSGGAVAANDEHCSETARLVACDFSGATLNTQRFATLVALSDDYLRQTMAFWGVADGLAHYGKIRLEFAPSRRGYYSTELHMRQVGTQRQRVLRVWGGVQEPQELVHKLTVALFPTSDKLLRNMMGGVAELRLGNRASFPGCGYAPASWVLAMRAAGAYVPLSELTEDHAAWGMAQNAQGWLYPTDRRRQHTTYAEAVAFGDFLVDIYGKDHLVQLFEHSLPRGERNWQSVYGKDLAELEQDWWRWLAGQRDTSRDEVATVAGIWGGTGDTCPAQRQGQ